jgi:hypothetical protein
VHVTEEAAEAALLQLLQLGKDKVRRAFRLLWSTLPACLSRKIYDDLSSKGPCRLCEAHAYCSGRSWAFTMRMAATAACELEL